MTNTSGSAKIGLGVTGPDATPQNDEAAERFAKEGETSDLSVGKILRSGGPKKVPVWTKWPAASTLVSLLGDKRPRLPTGFAPIDKAWRGGVKQGLRIAVLGAPSAGKTTWCVQVAVNFAKKGALVVFLAGDEGREGILTRIGQLHGYDRAALEDGFDSAKTGLAKALDELGIVLLDPDNDEGVTLANVADYIRTNRNGRAAFLFVDSLQTVAAAAAVDPMAGPRANVDALLGEVKRAARSDDFTVFLLSEMNRGAYRAKDGPQATSDMAAGKESGAIEYGMDAQIVLRAPEKGSKAVAVTVPKHRPGVVEPFSMEQDHRFASFSVVAEAEPPPAEDVAELSIVHALSGGPLARGQLFDVVGGNAVARNAALSRLLQSKRVVFAVGARGARTYRLGSGDSGDAIP